MKNLAEFLAAKRFQDSERAELPDEGRCIACDADLSESLAFRDYRVCDRCGFHYSLGAHRRLSLLLDPGSFRESNRSLVSVDPLAFHAGVRFRRRIFAEQRRTGLPDAVVTGSGTIAGRRVVVAAIDFRFLGGSIGCAAGEKLAGALEQGARRHLPVVTIVASGGVRIQEGVLALLQFAKVVEAGGRLAGAGEPHVVVLANPCLGGAYTVLGGLADLAVAEPGALLGYATTRSVEQSEGRQPAAGERSAEAQRQRGLVDEIVDRRRLRDFLSSLLEMLAARPRGQSGAGVARRDFTPAPHETWGTIQLARHAERPTATDYIGHFSDTFFELRGDRCGSDDPTVVAGIGMLGAEPVVYVGFQRARATILPTLVRAAGFRKARRAFELASRLRVPIVTLIDAATASPTVEAENEGLAVALAECMVTLSRVSTPVVGVVIGEARGETALALGLCDRLLMLQHAVFEVVSPETAASILYRDAGMAEEVAASLQPTAQDCLKLGIVDAIVPEPAAGAHSDHDAAARLLGAALLQAIAALKPLTAGRLVRTRYHRYRRTGQYSSYFTSTVGHDVAELGGDIARRAGDALARIARRARPPRAGAGVSVDGGAGSVPVS
jgi:acetyl-CoA carboxylase carboxyl transferase subunit beta